MTENNCSVSYGSNLNHFEQAIRAKSAVFVLIVWSLLVIVIFRSYGQGRRQLREMGGGGKIKIRGAKLKTSVELDPNFHYS